MNFHDLTMEDVRLLSFDSRTMTVLLRDDQIIEFRFQTEEQMAESIRLWCTTPTSQKPPKPINVTSSNLSV